MNYQYAEFGAFITNSAILSNLLLYDIWKCEIRLAINSEKNKIEIGSIANMFSMGLLPTINMQNLVFLSLTQKFYHKSAAL